MIKELVKLSNHLDAKGLKKEADYLDTVIRKIADDGGESLTSSVEYYILIQGKDNEYKVAIATKDNNYYNYTPHDSKWNPMCSGSELLKNEDLSIGCSEIKYALSNGKLIGPSSLDELPSGATPLN